MSDTISPLTPGGNILVQPLGNIEPYFIGQPVVYENGSWHSGRAIDGPRVGERFGSYRKNIAVAVNSSLGSHAFYVWNGAAWTHSGEYYIQSKIAVGEDNPGNLPNYFSGELLKASMQKYGFGSDYSKDLQRCLTAVEEIDTGRNPAPSDPVREKVDAVIGDLTARKVSDADRGRLRDAVDKADKPDTSRQGSDRLLGRAIGRKVAMDFGVRITSIPYKGYEGW